MNKNIELKATKLVKNNTIEFFRLIFTCIIVLWHSGFISNLKHGYLAVEFFFILSGYLLYNSFVKNKKRNIDAFAYTFYKLKRLYIPYMIAFSFVCILHIYELVFINRISIKEFPATILSLIPEVFTLQNIGIYNGGINYALWYFSVLIIGGHIIYALLDNNERFTVNFISPIIVILTFTFIFSINENIENWNTIGCFYLPFLRGIADMCIGLLLYKITMILPDKINAIGLYVLNLGSVVSFLLILYLMIASNYYDKYILVLIPLFMLGVIHSQGIFNKYINQEIWSRVGAYCFDFYLIHIFVKKGMLLFFSNVNSIFPLNFIIYLIGVLLFGIILHRINNDFIAMKSK